jgi:hypothetical protein
MPDAPVADAPAAEPVTSDAPASGSATLAEAPVTGSAAPDAPADVDPFDADPTADSFPRSYVERLRQEAAARRTEAQAFKEAFEGYSDDDRTVLLDLAKTLRTDPASAAEWMRAQAEALLAGDEAAGAGDGEGDDLDPDAPMTPAQLEKYLTDREAKKAAEAAETERVDAIVKEAEALGFSEKANRREYLALLDIATHDTGGDLAKAAEQLKAERQKVIDDFLAAKAAEADATPTTPSQAGGGREPFEAPKDWDDLRKVLR